MSVSWLWFLNIFRLYKGQGIESSVQETAFIASIITGQRNVWLSYEEIFSIIYASMRDHVYIVFIICNIHLILSESQVQGRTFISYAFARLIVYRIIFPVMCYISSKCKRINLILQTALQSSSIRYHYGKLTWFSLLLVSDQIRLEVYCGM